MEMKLDTPSSPDGEEEGEGVAAAGPEQAAAQEAAQPLEQAAVLKKGPWTAAEDAVLVEYVRRHGEGNWNAVRRATGLARCGKSCRLRWTNHLRPNLKKGSFTADEELLIARLHAELGNKWARMAAQLPGRTDNEIKNYWNTRLKRRQRAGLPVYPPEVQLHLALTKRCRYELSSSASSPTSIPPLDAGTASARYTNARPPPLDLTGQFAIANRPLPLIAPLPISAPTSPWAKPFARNALTFQFPHSSPVSPTTPVTPMLPVTPDLSLGYGIRSYDRSRLPPLSPSPGFKLELPSTQLRPAMLSATSASGGGRLQEQPNAARLEAMLQELHDAMEIKASVVAGDHEGRGGSGSGDEDGTVVERDSGSGDKTKAESKEGSRPMHENDIGTLFDLIPTSPLAEPGPAALKLSSLEHGNGDRDRSSLDLRTDLQLIGGISSTDQEWSLDGFC